jgi:hypothetical protein
LLAKVAMSRTLLLLPKGNAGSTEKKQNPIGFVADLRPVRWERQSVMVAHKQLLPGIVVALPHGDSR